MNGIMEIMTANKWLIEPTFGLKAVRLLNAMAAGHLQNDHEKVYGYRCYEQADGTFAAYAGDSEERGGKNGINEPFVNVLCLEGPLTREGGACTYGSRQLRDMMMEAADMEGCLGHLLLINGPGGMSNTIPDFLQATDYARSKGQPIVGRIDGCCASAHIWVSAMCDEVYYNNPTDQIGSVGIYWANILNKDGDIDPETGGKWHIVYDPQSYDKNRFARDLAENDDDTLIKEELIKDGEAFRNFIKARRPNVKDEHLHGKLFNAKDVEGIFVVGQATMQETFKRIVELSASAKGASSSKKTLSTQINNVNMKEQFPALFAALQVEEMQMQEGGAFMNEGLLATLNAAIEESQKQAADAKAMADQLNTEKAELEQKLETANSEHAAAIAALEKEKEDMQALLTAKDEALTTAQTEREADKAQIEKMTTELNGAKESLATAEGTLAERDQQITDLNAQIVELQNEPGEGAQIDGPATNGVSAEQPGIAISTQYVMDPNLPYEKNMRAKKEWETTHK